jgi:hypothetical protein
MPLRLEHTLPYRRGLSGGHALLLRLGRMQFQGDGSERRRVPLTLDRRKRKRRNDGLPLSEHRTGQ